MKNKFFYMNENWEIAVGDTPRPTQKRWNDGCGQVCINMETGEIRDGKEWKKLPTAEEFEVQDAKKWSDDG